MDALTGFLPPGQVNDPPLPLMDRSWKIPPEGEGGFKGFERGKIFFFHSGWWWFTSSIFPRALRIAL